MQHTKKMVVVPQDVIENLRFNQQQRIGSVGRQLMTVDKELKEILARDDLPADEKMELYYEILQKHKKMETKYRERSPIRVQNIAREPTNQPRTAPKQSDEWLDRIDKQFTVRNREKAEQMYEWLKEKSDIKWNDKGEIDGQPKSNILTLLDDVTRPQPRVKGTDPTGLADFAGKLQASNIPRYLIGNSTHYKKYFQQPSTSPPPSPPSSPESSYKTPINQPYRRPHRLVSDNVTPVPSPSEAIVPGWISSS